VAEARGRNGKLTEVITKTGQTMPCSLLGLAAGVRPDKELGQAAGLATDQGVLVNEYLETSAPGVFAAGNVAQVRDPETGGTWLETLWDTARIQGEVAGANMTGARIVCAHATPFNVVRIGGIIVATIGVMMDKATPDVISLIANNASHTPVAPHLHVHHSDRVNRVRVMVGARTILGAVVLGEQSFAHGLHRMVEARADISSIRPALLERPEQGINALLTFYREWQHADRTA
jgi:NADPH-dependent 2,4-dienoyl-CoA reductase/sulfur reductase-like enzyme